MSRLKDTYIVCEFTEVFLDDITSLPTTREIDFMIEVATGTNTISKVPYRMTPTEIK